MLCPLVLLRKELPIWKLLSSAPCQYALSEPLTFDSPSGKAAVGAAAPSTSGVRVDRTPEMADDHRLDQIIGEAFSKSASVILGARQTASPTGERPPPSRRTAPNKTPWVCHTLPPPLSPPLSVCPCSASSSSLLLLPPSSQPPPLPPAGQFNLNVPELESVAMDVAPWRRGSMQSPLIIQAILRFLGP